MSQPQKRPKPLAGGFGGKARQSRFRDSTRSERSSNYLPNNWRDRIPAPAIYYAQHLKLSPPNALGWAQAPCPFHEDRNASFSVNLTGERGAWRCFASCGGGDMVGFHMRRSGMSFVDAVRDLIGGAR